MSPQLNSQIRPPVGSLVSESVEQRTTLPPVTSEIAVSLVDQSPLADATISRPQEPVAQEQSAQPQKKSRGFLSSALFSLNLVRKEQPQAFYGKCILSAAETIYQAVPLLLVAPFAQSLSSGNFKTSAIIGAVLAGCWLIREGVVCTRDYINDKFFRDGWNTQELSFLGQHLSRSLETIRSTDYSDKVTKVREQGQRLASFNQRLFEMSGSLVNVTAAATGLAFYNPVAAAGILGVGTLTLINYVRYARDFNTTEDSVAEVRRRLWHRRAHVSTTQAVREVKLLGKEQSAMDAVKESDRQLAAPRLADTLRLTHRNLVSGTLSYALNVTIVGTAALQTAMGNLPSESLMQIISMTLYSGMQLAMMSKSISDILQDFTVVREALAIDQQGVPERIPGKSYRRLNPEKAPLISLKNVTYLPQSSPAGSKPILDNLSMTLEPGKVYGLCGESGAGKTTLMRLLMREVTPTSGEILFDGIPMEEIDPDDIRAATRYLAQDFVDFDSYTVEQAVSLGKRPDSLGLNQDMKSTLHQAAVDFVDLSELDTVVGVDFTKARDFSGGERQRLAIARTLIGKATLLVLDEPTSRIDHDNEDHIFSHLLAKDPEAPRTVVIISHRFANLKDADHIFFLKKGEGISEQGSHAELLELDGAYARLFRREQQSLDD